MPADQILDLFTDDEGDIRPGYQGDLLVARDSDVVMQEVLWRLKTVRGDWQLRPECGADLELLIGLPNSPKTAAQAEAQIARALTHDGFLNGELRQVRVVPVNKDQLLGIITIEWGDETFSATVTLDLKEGVL